MIASCALMSKVALGTIVSLPGSYVKLLQMVLMKVHFWACARKLLVIVFWYSNDSKLAHFHQAYVPMSILW